MFQDADHDRDNRAVVVMCTWHNDTVLVIFAARLHQWAHDATRVVDCESQSSDDDDDW